MNFMESHSAFVVQVDALPCNQREFFSFLPIKKKTSARILFEYVKAISTVLDTQEHGACSLL